MWWIKLTILLSATIAITVLILWSVSWIEKNKETHPEIYKRRGIIGALVYVILNL